MQINISANNVNNLPFEERQMLQKLVKLWKRYSFKNQQKERYYEGKVSLGEVNLGIALPNGMAKLEIGCAWGAKAVDVLAARSMFDGYVGVNGENDEELDAIVQGNHLIAEYQKAARDELKYGCTFATLSADDDIGCKIRFHSPQTASAIWDGEKGRIACGMTINATQPTDATGLIWEAVSIFLFTDDAIWEMTKKNGTWTAVAHPHKMGRPLMEPLIWNATTKKPLGQSRIKEPVRRLIQGYVRTVANATIGLEFSTAPQKYLLGITDEQYDMIVSDKFRQYVGSIIAGTTNPETGEKPTFGQLQQGTITPHVEMLRALATQFSAATGLSVVDTGVINNANPTSSEAIIAQTQTLIGMAEQLNTGNGDSLQTIAQMALAIANDKTLDELTDEQKSIIAHFQNPAMPSVAATADAAIKIATSRPAFAQTDTFLEMIGFDQADIRRIKAQEALARGLAVIQDEMMEE